MESLAIMAPSVPKVIPFPLKPVATYCFGAVSPMNGRPSAVSMTWPDHLRSTVAPGIKRRQRRSRSRNGARVSPTWAVL
jgi:hypothetical protein